MSTPGVRLKQVGVVLLGLVAAAVMVGLGIWQLNVYSSQGVRAAQARAAEPAVSLLSAAPPGGTVGDVYGRTVTATGRYDANLQVLVPVDGAPYQERVLTALRFASGGAVPVVRGVVTAGSPIPAPPPGEATVTGLFLPSEPDAQRNPTLGGALASIQLPVLAQRWSPPLSNGFVTLTASESAAQGLGAATAALPQSQGRAQNAGYALQWWIFAGFALVMAGRMARDFGRRADTEYLRETAALGDLPDLPELAEVPQPSELPGPSATGTESAQPGRTKSA